MNHHDLSFQIAVARIQAQSQRMLDDTRATQAHLRQAVDQSDYERADGLYQRWKEKARLRSELDNLITAVNGHEGTESVFLVGSRLLYQVYKELAAVQTEAIQFAAGSAHGYFRTIENPIPLELESSSMGHATGDLAFTTKLLVELEEYGALLTAYFHMHPGNGTSMTRPSGTDMQNQALLERGSFKTVGGIFSRDGYLRFFADAMPYKVVISGKGVEDVGENLYRLTAL